MVRHFRWSTRIYFELSNLMNPSHCASLCLLNSTITCHFSLVLNETCYLGNILHSSSVLVDRTDSQNIYKLQGTGLSKCKVLIAHCASLELSLRYSFVNNQEKNSIGL